MQEVVADRSATIALQLYSDETRVESSTAVTVEVRRADGTVVLPAGTATTASGTGRYERALTPAQLPEVDILTATWSVTLDGQAQTRQTTVEIIGAHYFELAELRAMPGLSDVSRFPPSKLAEKRTEAQNEIEREAGVAFVERYGERSLYGTGAGTIWLRSFIRRLLSGSAAGVAFTTEQLAAMSVYDYGRVDWSGGRYTTDALVLRYVHAYTTTPPAEIHDIALELARLRILGWRGPAADQTVEADDLGQQTPAGDANDRKLNQNRLVEVLRAWRQTEIGPVFA